MTEIKGYIPTCVGYVHKDKETVTLAANGKTAEVTPTTVVEQGARRGKGPEPILRVNLPISNLQLINLEKKGNHYPIQDGWGNCFEIRDEYIMEALFKSGIKKGGKLNGKWVWGKVGSKLQLMRVGSPIHKELKKLTKKRPPPKIIPAEDFIPGGIYVNTGGSYCIFLGWVEGSSVMVVKDVWTSVPTQSQYRAYNSYYAKKICQWTVEAIPYKRSTLFITIQPNEVRHTSKQVFDRYLNRKSHYAPDIKQDYTPILRVNQLEVPEDIIIKFREKAFENCLVSALNGKDYERRTGNQGSVDYAFAYNFCDRGWGHRTRIATMVPAGSTLPLQPEILNMLGGWDVKSITRRSEPGSNK